MDVLGGELRCIGRGKSEFEMVFVMFEESPNDIRIDIAVQRGKLS